MEVMQPIRYMSSPTNSMQITWHNYLVISVNDSIPQIEAHNGNFCREISRIGVKIEIVVDMCHIKVLLLQG